MRDAAAREVRQNPSRNRPRSWMIRLMTAAGSFSAPACGSSSCRSTYWDAPDRTYNCIGVTFSFYPPFAFGAFSVDYCVGWEEPVGLQRCASIVNLVHLTDSRLCIIIKRLRSRRTARS
jgi:hypothetical protein